MTPEANTEKEKSSVTDQTGAETNWFGRRDFLKATGAAAVGVIGASGAAAAADPEVRLYNPREDPFDYYVGIGSGTYTGTLGENESVYYDGRLYQLVINNNANYEIEAQMNVMDAGSGQHRIEVNNDSALEYVYYWIDIEGDAYDPGDGSTEFQDGVQDNYPDNDHDQIQGTLAGGEDHWNYDGALDNVRLVSSPGSTGRVLISYDNWY